MTNPPKVKRNWPLAELAYGDPTVEKNQYNWKLHGDLL